MTEKKTIQFMAQRKLAAALSILLLIGSVVSLALNGLQFGLDFTGGTQLELGFEEPVRLAEVRETLEAQALKGASVVYYGAETDILIRMPGSLRDLAIQRITENLQQRYGPGVEVVPAKVGIGGDRFAEKLIVNGAQGLQADIESVFPSAQYGLVRTETAGEGRLAVLLADTLDTLVSSALVKGLQAATDQQVELRRSEFVGPQVGEELRDDGGLGLLFALAVVMAYVAMRFQFKFSVGAVTALAHDVIIVLGTFSVLRLDFDLTVLAAVLAVIGYSLNDTIVVFDRIRENFRKIRKGSAEEVINISLSQTLGRTFVTSLTTLLVLMALFLFGGELIHGFATALIVGIVVGTYSSIYVAANVLLMMKVSKEDLIVPDKEGAELEDGMP